MWNFVDRLSVHLADILGVDRCLMVCRVRLLLTVRPEVWVVYREILRRVDAAVPKR